MANHTAAPSSTPAQGLSLELTHQLDPDKDLERELLVLGARLAAVSRALDNPQQPYDQRVGRAGLHLELAITTYDEVVEIVTKRGAR